MMKCLEFGYKFSSQLYTQTLTNEFKHAFFGVVNSKLSGGKDHLQSGHATCL